MGNTLTTLQPGSGYIYKSASSAGDRTLVFPAPAGTSKAAAPATIQQPKAKMDASLVKRPRTMDIDLPIRK